jgi:hypothetical protein
MLNLTAHHLRFKLKVETTIELDEHQGAALRGMLYNALRGPENNPALGFCTQRRLKACAGCALVAACPVASLVATLNPAADRGRDVPRPYAIVPSLLPQTCYEPGELLSFGLTLFGDALNLFPYVVMALHQAGPHGLGKRLPRAEAKAHHQGGRYLRGRFTVQSALAANLLTGEVQDILQPGSTMVQQPNLPVNHAQIIEASQQLLNPVAQHGANGRHCQATYQPAGQNDVTDFSLIFRTPTRIVSAGKLLKKPLFTPLFHRLLNRLLALEQEFGGDGAAPVLDKNGLLALSDQVELVTNHTHWQELWSYSGRQGRQTPISGLMGSATYRAPREIWQALLPYLLWGTITHVGKNAVKGDGIVAVSR